MKAGLGIRGELFEDVFAKEPNVGFFEAHSENYFGDSMSRYKLQELRQDYPVSLHGVGLSLGRADNLDKNHLKQLKSLVDQIEPFHVSEHLSWSAFEHIHVPDLLPLPLTEQSLQIMQAHIDEMQEVLNRQILIENPSNYLLFDQLQIPEPEFLNCLAERTGCGLLVDINNISVSSQNLKRDPYEYIKGLDKQHIKQYHLAGYTPVESQGEKVLIDTHNQPIYPEVWDLYTHILGTHGEQPTLIEWDSDFPDFEVLIGECEKADVILDKVSAKESHTANWAYEINSEPIVQQGQFDETKQQAELLRSIIDKADQTEFAVDEHKPRLWVYQNNVYGALVDYLLAVFPASAGVVGEDYFRQMAGLFVKDVPPIQGDIHLYGEDFGDWIQKLSALKPMPYLKDIISYEWAKHHSYYAAVSDLDVVSIPQEELLTMTVALSDSAFYVSSLFPLQSIYQQSLPGYQGEVSINLEDGGNAILVYKANYQVVDKLLNESEQLFFETLSQSDSLIETIEKLGENIAPEMISQLLGFCFENKLIKQVA